MDIERRIYLIKKFLDRTLLPEEKREFDAWLGEDERNVRLLNRIRDRKEVVERLEFYSRLDDGWENIRREAGLGRTYRKVWGTWMKYAALVAVVFMVGYAVIEFIPGKQGGLPEDELTGQIHPVSHRAVIELANGERLLLGDSLDLKRRKVDGADLQEDAEKLVVCEDGESPDTDRGSHKIIVPRGGEYQVVLPDGTKVWLNSESRLDFPAVFGKNERVVRIEGEAYFEVTHKKDCPFKVVTEKMAVRVLGTEFNVNTHEGQAVTTLASGSVELVVGKQTYRMKPGEQSVVGDGKVDIREVNIREFVAWKDGVLVFRNRRLEEVLNTLARWYDVDVFYQNEKVKDLHFTGNIRRHTAVKEVLLFLEETELIKFEIQGKTLVVSEK